MKIANAALLRSNLRQQVNWDDPVHCGVFRAAYVFAWTQLGGNRQLMESNLRQLLGHNIPTYFRLELSEVDPDQQLIDFSEKKNGLNSQEEAA